MDQGIGVGQAIIEIYQAGILVRNFHSSQVAPFHQVVMGLGPAASHSAPTINRPGRVRVRPSASSMNRSIPSPVTLMSSR